MICPGNNNFHHSKLKILGNQASPELPIADLLENIPEAYDSSLPVLLFQIMVTYRESANCASFSRKFCFDPKTCFEVGDLIALKPHRVQTPRVAVKLLVLQPS